MDDAEAPAEGIEPPPVPEEPWSIPENLVAAWLDMPQDVPLAVVVTRRMLDNLFFALHKMAIGQADMDVALVAYSNGDLDQANSRLMAGRRNNLDAVSSARRMIAGFMETATVIPDE